MRRKLTAKGTFGGDSSVLYLDWSGCLLCQNTANCTLKNSEFYFM